jgi:predicted O-linked N-acetylglucosamine transferase (SPINDLY family)
MQKPTDSSKFNAVDKFQQAFQLHQQGQLEQAEALYAELLKEQPHHIDALHFSGVLANQLGHAQRAVDLISLALEINPNNAAAHSNLGLALYALKHFDEALASYNSALALKPNNVETHYNCGNVLLALNRFNEALISYNHVLAIKPDHADAHWGASWCYLSLGDFDNGWKEYEWRWQTDDFKHYVRNFSKPQWFGEESLRGKTILLHNNEQGLGDTLQFCRYAKQVADLGARVILEVPKTLLALLAKLEGVTELIAQGSALPAFDFHCPLLSLPLAFKTRLDSIPANIPYLFSEPDKVKQWQAVLGEKTKPRIGLVWVGNAAHKNDHNRSLALHKLLPLLTPDYQFISLQKELHDTDRALLAQQPLLQHYGEQINDFTDTAALSELMDVVISVDTSVAHLAAAMGKPTWILLPYSPDWRWLIDRCDSPWYPTVRLFRQSQRGDWQGVIERLRHELITLPAVETAQQSQPAQSNIDLFPQAFSLHQQGQLAQAERLYEQLLKEQPHHIDALHFSGVLANQLGHAQRAVDLISLALEINPNNAAAHSNLGLALHALKRFDEALTSYDHALVIKPNNAEAYYNRGNALLALKCFDEALVSYDRALVIKPDYAEAFSNRANTLKELNRHDEALTSYNRALVIKPDYAQAELGCATLLQELRRYNEAIIHYDRALAIKPDLEFILGTRLHLKLNMCAWNDFDYYLDKLEKSIERDEKVIVPFSALAMFASAAVQQKAACCHAKAKYPSHFLLPPLVKHTHSKIKLAYFSSDFRHHPVAYLAAELFERHDRSQFEVIAFSLHAANHKDDMRLRLEAGFDQFMDVSEHSDEQIVRLARELEIDIAVDLTGCTEGGRTAVFAMRVAPIQVNYLGYSGTMGADYMDYLLADSVIIPPEYRPYYTEKIAYLPNSYMVNDSTRVISNRQFTRTECGLPEQGFVFCCFNNAYKITPEVFAIWMRILHQIEGSVLWLSAGSAEVVSNLQREAQARGIAANRLIFAPRLNLVADHLARQRVADLFLDTLPYNAHTTTSDALWAGLPVLTRVGAAYASRVAASLLSAVGLPELITSNAEDYQALAIQLASHPEQLAAIRQKLADNRLTYPLFDTALFTQHIESAYQAMMERYQAGLAPDHIYVQAQDNVNQLPEVLPVEINANTFQQALNLHQQGQLEHAEILYKALLKAQPQHIDALHFSGVLANQLGQSQRAVELIERALAISPNNAAAHSNLGLALHTLKHFDEALASYDRALVINPNNAEAHYNRGNALLALNHLDEAIISFDHALSIKPDYAVALSNRGNALKALKRYDEALASYQRALAIRPDYAEAELGCGDILQDLKHFNEAIAHYNHALAIKPDMDFILGTRLYMKMNICAWDNVDDELSELAKGIEEGKKVSMPFTLQAVSSSAALQKKAAEIYTKERHPSDFLLPPLVKYSHSKIKIAYFSADFCHHAVAYLMAELFERHDRSQFEVIAFSLNSASHKDEMRLKLETIFDQFIDVSHQADKQVVQLARELGCDIAIDLNGLTGGCRPDIFALRAAPIQVSYLGYLGTLGADYIDYLLADRTLIPVEHQAYYNEKIAYLPDSFQVNDSTLLIADKAVTRSELGLPEQGFVFCCFNNHYKITPIVFSGWMRILHHVEGSVLWLLGGNVVAETNLRLAATARGIDAERLVFSKRVPMPDYLAQHRVADLFLDTAPYNAGATASAALWAGLPILTYLGDTFSGRMAASLLHAIGLSELVTNSPEDYEALAIQLATHPEQLAAIRKKLADNRLTYPLFNTKLFTQHIESAYQAMMERYQAGLAPDHITVQTKDDTAKPVPSSQSQQKNTLSPIHTVTFQQAVQLHQQGQLEQAAVLYEALLQAQPQQADALHLFGVLNYQRGQAQIAVDLISQSLNINPNDATAHSNIGLAFQALGCFDEALASYDRALAIAPHSAETLYNRGNLLLTHQHFDEALISYDRALVINPNYVEAYSNRGVALQNLRQLDAALASYERALAINPDYAEGLTNRGNTLKNLNRFHEALSSYDHALVIAPNDAETLTNRGNVLQELRDLEVALESYDRALVIKPDYTEALLGRGVVLQDLKRFNEAILSYERALAINPDHEFLFGTWLSLKTKLCDWGEFDNNLNKLINGIESGKKIADPFSVMPLSASAAVQQKAACCYITAKHPSHFLLPPLVKHAHSKIKLAYFSADFRHHPVAYLAAELFGRHNRSQFEVIAFSFHVANHKDDMRLRLEAGFDQFIDVSEQSDEQIVRLARELEIDIAVDLTGCTKGGRTAVFAMRVAPIQVNYLGYSGTMGADYMDYLLADSVLIPMEYQPYYTEKIAYLPDSYMVNDSTRVISNRQFTRTELGLPEQGFVFCCFNNAYKITPAVFTIWMRLLHQIEGSMLWLSESGAEVVSNLQREAKARGIAVNRLIFAQRLPLMADHLARHRLADLFLDTLPYNAHTTTSDALWAGLPVLTCAGEAFASRVAASLLHAIGLSELVTNSPEDYEALAIKLARHPEQLAVIKQKLAANRLTYPLFNTALFTQHIESAYQAMVDRYQAGLAPDHITVQARDQSKFIAPTRPEPVEEGNSFSNADVKTSPVALPPQSKKAIPVASFHQAVQLHQQGQLEQAEALYKAILQAQPQHADALHLLGVIAKQRGQAQLAVDLINQSLQINPNNAAAHSNIGLAFQSLKRFDDALASYERALAIAPNYAEALFNQGMVLQNLERLEEAVASYDRALIIAPNYAETSFNRGVALQGLNRLDESLASYDRSLAIQPDYAEALFNRGNVLATLKRFEEAIASYQRALAIKPDLELLYGTWLHTKMNVCDWREFEQNVNQLNKEIALGKKVCTPFVLQAISSSAALLKKVAVGHTNANYPDAFLLPPLKKHAHSKIKIAYFSSDFRNHPVAHLTAELFERHDRSRFEIIAFSFHAATHKDEIRLKLETVFDQFIDVSQQADEQVVRLARELEIDIAVDLNGLTEGSRTRIFAMRAAPVQVIYLGYLGTMGVDYMDYLLADSTLIPIEHQVHYAEKIAYLPYSYQVNVTNRPISNRQFTRVELGLPAQGFVFCCFNANYKITPAVFDSWMRLLHHVESSVLWLLEENTVAAKNLRREAIARGINAERLVFAKRVPVAEHLARHRAADLFLDTTPCNAGATASDALWAGLPLLTYLGDTFSGRMAASLLYAIGLPELVTKTPAEYEALAIQLATHPEQLHALKQKLAANRLTYPLFNTALFTQHIESAYQIMFDRYQVGLAPDYIYVAAQDTTTTVQQPSVIVPMQNSTVAIDSEAVEALINQGNDLEDLNQLEAALASYDKALSLNPNYARAHSNRGNVLQSLKRFAEALASYQRALAIRPDYAEAFYNSGNALLALGRLDQALVSYERALTIKPDLVIAMVGRGTVLQELNRFDEALANYDRVLAVQPNYAEVHYNRGKTLQDLKRFDEALASYDDALVIKSDYVEALIGRNAVLQNLKRFDEALASYDRVLAIAPNYAEVYASRGILLQRANRFDEALSNCEQALALKPDMEFMFGTWLHLKMKIADWRDFDINFNQLVQKITQGEKVCTPFAVQALSNSAALQKKAADCYIQKFPANFLLPPLKKYAHSKIKIAYFSSDFRRHPVAHLTAELFERHDRSRFEIIAFSFHAASHKDDMRLRLEAAFDQFIDVSQQSDEQVARLARELEIDIAVDLNGLTEGNRINIFALRAAPIQVSYLGYLGTMGADYMDYLLADSTLIPVEHQAYYTEKIAYLPQSFQVNDSKLLIATKTFTRAELGLPTQGFVFCCFNASFKITPIVFDSWMRLLHQVKGSVLWLLEENNVVAKNLRREAIARGITAERLVFAQRLPIAEHLARHRVADLFLDTSPCNAGATASDALWAGLPLLTCLGDTFSGRMAASLLYAIGLPELVTKTPAEYEALAVQLATHPEQLRDLKQKLADNRLTYPLFNTALLTQHIESVYQAMFDRYQAGLAPDYIYVKTAEVLKNSKVLQIGLAADTITPLVAKKPPKQSVFGKIAQKPAQLFAGITAFRKRKNKTDTPAPVDMTKFEQAQKFYQRGQLEVAAALYEEFLKIQPDHAEALRCLATIKKQRGKTPQISINSIIQAPKIATNNVQIHWNAALKLPDSNRLNAIPASLTINPIEPEVEAIEALVNEGNELEDLNRLDEALASYDRALALHPNYARAHSNRGNVLQLLKRFDDALASYDHALAIRPDYAEAFFNRGNALQALRRFDEALASYDNALAIKPAFVIAIIARGAVLQDLKRFDDALASYDRALAIQPAYAEALYNRGNVLQDLNRLHDALDSYDRALSINPDYTKALYSRGMTLQNLKRFDEALASYDHALALSPDYADALASRGIVLQLLNRFDEALSSYEQALAIQPDMDFMFGTWLSLKMKRCDWRDFDAHLKKISEKILRGEKAATPFFIHSISPSIAVQKKTAEIFAQEKYPRHFLLPAIKKHPHAKIKIAYFSSDFRSHAVAYLTAELFERHDRSKFEVIAFSFHVTNYKDDTRLKLEKLFDQFMDVSSQSDEQVVRLARELEIDIAIDLNGFTEGCRTNVFAMQTAPIQVSYLGYSGTMGADYMDYIIADSVLIPTPYRPYYTEKIVTLPNSYMVNDTHRPIANRQFTRAELGLPEQGFVFCCFNLTYKITPTVFDVWMRILHQVDGSVLWLSASNADAVSNLRQEATARGIHADRLIFAHHLALLPEHLARHRLADLFLDTLPFNAHTTTSDALWAGLPVLSCAGEAFTSRVAASLLTAIGLPELITNTLEDYEALAVQLATHPEQLRAIKQKLADNRLTYPLFNTVFFTQHIESAYQAMFDRYQAGLTPDYIYVKTAEVFETSEVLPTAHPTDTSQTNSTEFLQAVELHQQGNTTQAEILYNATLQAQAQPQHADALHLLGVLNCQRGQTQLAVDLISQSLSINSNNADAHSNLGLAFQALNRFDEALASYERALSIQPNHVETLFNRGMVLLSLQRFEEAVVSYDHVLRIQPDYAEALCNRGVALQKQKRLDDALASYDRALTIRPDYAEVLTNRGNVLREQKRLNEAVSSYDHALTIATNDLETLTNRGNALAELKRYEDALASYDRALAIAPDYVAALCYRGVVLQDQNRWDDALASYDRALAIAPDYSDALCYRGLALQELKRYDEALASYQRALTINPDHEFLFGSYLSLKMKLCDWRDFEHTVNQLQQKIAHGEKALSPFAILAMSSSAALQKRVAEIYIDAKHPNAFLLPALTKHTHSKIRIAYFSADFYDHATAHLMAELFERHDKSRFELIAFSFNPQNANDKTRSRLEAAFDQFIDINQQSDEQVVRLARELEIDIAIDLKGFTQYARVNLFAMRVAPIQVNYLGYPGTMGADYIDYLIADSVLIPTEYQAYYSEKIAYLPNSYQVNDSTRPIANKQFTRAELGLPEQGFVFCCFNNNYKITPSVFDSWMRLLQQIEGSVLWLLSDNSTAETNLRQAATARGIAAECLVFAQRLALPEHLARHRVADLFLDTVHCNAHTTASDALWAGLPVLTCVGEVFASRVAASLLTAVGLPELITTNLEDYETLAIQLASHPEQLKAIKQRLADNRLTYPLFNTALFTQHIESAYQAMFDRYQADLAPEHIYVQTCEVFKTSQVLNHDNADKFAQAINFHRQGQLAEAEALYEDILQTEPQHIDALHFLGVLKNQQRQPQRAVELIKQSIQHYPNNAAAHSNLAIALYTLNRFDEVLMSYEQVLTLTPDNVEILTVQGNLLLLLNRPKDALASYDKALVISPDAIEIRLSRGMALQALNRFAEALIDYDHVLAINADNAEVWFGRANVLYNLRQLPDALSSYDRSLAINPHSAEAFYNRGILLSSLNRSDEAISSYKQALAIKPDYAEVHNNLGMLLKNAESEACYRRAIAIKPNYVDAHCRLITLLKDQGHSVEAKASLDTALAAIPDNLELQMLQLILTLPMVLKTATESVLALEQFDNTLNGLAISNHAESLSKASLLPLPFLLAYRTGNHVQRLSRYGDLIAVPSKFTATKTTRKKLKMVVVSHHFRRHSVWDVITRGLLVNIDRTRFELVLYHLGNIEDQETAFAKSLADEWRDTHTMIDLSDWLTALSNDTPDIIFYPEIGMDPMSARLAAHRLAPLQMASWGHPITTGLPTIDVYFSGELLESPNADSHYRERLIRLPSTGCCTTLFKVTPELLPELKAQLATRQGITFVIAQTPYKFDPADDELYADIASVVGDSTFILLRANDDAWAMDQIIARLEQTFVDRGLNPQQHLLVIPWLSVEKFQSLLELCDIYLDCPSFSGYTTAWQAVHHGLPIVTLEGEFMRQRLAAGLLRKIGITDTIASSREEYVKLAAQLAEECHNPVSRAARRTALKTAASKADNDISVVRAFEKSVINALAERS